MFTLSELQNAAFDLNPEIDFATAKPGATTHAKTFNKGQTLTFQLHGTPIGHFSYWGDQLWKPTQTNAVSLRAMTLRLMWE